MNAPLTDSELLGLLRLQRIPKIGAINAKKLLEHCGDVSTLFNEKQSTLQKIDGIGSVMLEQFFDPIFLEEAEAELNYIQQNNISYVHYKSPAYPRYLKHCIDSPLLLFQKGNIDIQNRKLISIVGTRKITSYGQRFCNEFIEEIAPLNPVIVSGFAYGVDITAQRAAMDNGLQTIGCLAHGLNQIYPKAHDKYVPKLLENGGFYTEFWSTSKPDRENFLKRNRIIAGLSEATIVVESADKGGSLVTADLAHSYNREVFAVPGRVTDNFSLGCNNLIKNQKAQMLTSAAELIYLLRWQLEKQEEKVIQKQLFVSMDETEKSIYNYLQLNGKQLLDIVALECNLPIFKASSTLLNMEMKGLIRPLPGKLFEVV